MKRPINICSGQFGDLTLEELCKTMHEIGYNGIEIATQAHLDVRRVLTDAAYRDQIDETLNKYDMHRDTARPSRRHRDRRQRRTHRGG